MVEAFPGVVVDRSSSFRSAAGPVEYWFADSGARYSYSGRYSVLGFHGAGVLGGTLVTTVGAAEQAFSRVEGWQGLRELILNSTGSFAVELKDSVTGSILFLNDPLGGAYIFEYEDSGMVIASASLATIKLISSIREKPLTREPFFEIANFATGTAVYGASSPYTEVSTVRPGYGLEVHLDGRISRLSIGVREHLVELKSLAYEELLAGGVDGILNNINAALDCGAAMTVSDLSGGFDSRLLLAGILAAGRQSEVVFSSIRSSGEWEYVKGLADEFNLNLTDIRFNGHEALRGAAFFERSISGARSSAGFIDFGLDPSVAEAPIVSLQGGYGETFRTFSNFYYSSSGVISDRVLAEQLWAWKRVDRASVDGRTLMTNTTKDRLLLSLSDVFERVRSDGVALDYMTNATYLESRNRQWIGQKSFWWSMKMARFDPLYNLPLIAAAEKLDFWNRRANFVGLDVMRRLQPRLLELPFYNRGVISDRYRASRGISRARPFGDGSSRVLAADELGWQRPSSFNARSAGGATSVKGHDAGSVLDRSLAEWCPYVLEAILDRQDLRCYFDEKALTTLLTPARACRENVSIVEKLAGCLIRIGALESGDLPLKDRWLLA